MICNIQYRHFVYSSKIRIRSIGVITFAMQSVGSLRHEFWDGILQHTCKNYLIDLKFFFFGAQCQDIKENIWN